MDAEGVCHLYEHSLRKHGMRYIPFVGDGDSKCYASVTKSEPYGPGVFIPKEDCIGHVTKRMGTALRKVLTDYKGNINSLYMKNILYLLKHCEYGLYLVKDLKFKVVLFLRANFQHEYSQPENVVLLLLDFFLCGNSHQNFNAPKSTEVVVQA